jgi:hypothetical protein
MFDFNNNKKIKIESLIMLILTQFISKKNILIDPKT